MDSFVGGGGGLTGYTVVSQLVYSLLGVVREYVGFSGDVVGGWREG